MNLLLLSLVAGCPKGGGPSGPAPSFVPIPGTVDYVRYTVAGPFDLEPLNHREEWSGPTPQGDLLYWDVATYDTTEGGRELLETVRVFVGPDGYGFLGTVEDGALTPWEPPQVVLPAEPTVGMTWTGTHVKSGRTSERSCELLAAPHCEGGFTSVCESRKERGVVVLRDHFCPGEGWTGFEALQQVGGQPSVRMWSEEVLRDGRPATALPRPEDESEEAAEE